jgi:hypothetical protein
MTKTIDGIGHWEGPKPRKGGTKKIADLPAEKHCQHPEHSPPSMRVLEPGLYRHECPGCGKVMYFTVPESGRL